MLATSLLTVGLTYQRLGQHDKALAYLLRMQEILEKAAGPMHADTAHGLNRLAVSYTGLGEYEQALRSLELAGLGAFIDVLVAGNEVTEGKPAPEIFLRAAAGIGIEAQRCVALEDSSVGVHAAAKARMLTIMVPDLHQPNAETAALAHYVIPGTERAARVVLTLFDALEAHKP